MTSHPDNIGPNRTSRVSYTEWREHRGYTRYDPNLTAASLQRAIAKLSQVAVPKYRYEDAPAPLSGMSQLREASKQFHP